MFDHEFDLFFWRREKGSSADFEMQPQSEQTKENLLWFFTDLDFFTLGQ